MKRSLILTAAGLSLAGASSLSCQPTVHRSASHDFRVVTVVDGLEHPWSITFLPGGDMLVTERPGRLRIVRHGALLPDSVPGVPAVYARGQGGLLDVLPHPDFATNRLLYLSFSKPVDDGDASTTAVVRGRFADDRLTDVEVIFEAATRGRGHYGSRLA
ncbi:MAG: PQQ-dependent sugar dehydrogenase, partial [Gemmatimonadota bacterium]|nr:PQQ-dependent sugar dehydrogenase [Gemmatimonadota bacterium]